MTRVGQNYTYTVHIYGTLVRIAYTVTLAAKSPNKRSYTVSHNMSPCLTCRFSQFVTVSPSPCLTICRLPCLTICHPGSLALSHNLSPCLTCTVSQFVTCIDLHPPPSDPSRVGQNHAYIRIYGVFTVCLAGE